jgi:carbon monoxide dehydrogenase subunit G
MELEHNFTVAVPVEAAWDVLLDLERIAPCMPGATLTSYEGEEFTGTVRVKLGPVTMTFTGQGRFAERDAGARRMVIEASGKDRRGGGTARATIRATLREEDSASTAVAVNTDLVVTGRVAQFGRGMIADVSTRLLGQFTDCLAGKLAGPEAQPAAPPAPQPSVAPAPQTPSPATAIPATAIPATAIPATAIPEAAIPEAAAAAGGPPAPQAPVGATRPTEAEPIDLLAVTGVRAAAGRLVPYVITFLAGALVGAGVTAWLLR